MQKHKYFVIFFIAACVLLINVDAYSSSTNQGWKIKKSNAVKITIDDKSVVRKELPDKLFSFNINYIATQRQLWDRETNSIKAKVIEHLDPFDGSVYRYPGGIVADNLEWAGIIGPVSERKPQKSFYNRKPVKIRFGIDEYIDFVNSVNGETWYVLNLVGKNALEPLLESDKTIVADINKKLAEYLKPKLNTTPHYYQLGNELDRSKYEWSPEKYVERSRETISKMLEVDEDARFVAFLREFKWKYKKYPERGVSKPYDLMKTVLDGLPMVNDYSLHHYYDGKRTDGKNLPVSFWMKKLNGSIRDYREIRDGESPNIWITEHARQKSSNKPGKDNTRFYTSNLGGSISTADYLIALAQVPEVKGAFLHALNAGPWQPFDYSIKYKDLRPRPIFETIKMLRNTEPRMVLETHTQSPNYSNYKGGYDVRAVGFRGGSKGQLAVWVVNRASRTHNATIEYKPFSGKKVEIFHQSVAGKEGIDFDDLDLKPVLNLNGVGQVHKFSENGQLSIKLPPSSISNILIQTRI